MRAIRLRTEYMENPIGIDIREPYLSWNCSGGKKQTAYEIRAASGNRVIWNSGKVAARRMSRTGPGAGAKRPFSRWGFWSGSSSWRSGLIRSRTTRWELARNEIRSPISPQAI